MVGRGQLGSYCSESGKKKRPYGPWQSKRVEASRSTVYTQEQSKSLHGGKGGVAASYASSYATKLFTILNSILRTKCKREGEEEVKAQTSNLKGLFSPYILLLLFVLFIF